MFKQLRDRERITALTCQLYQNFYRGARPKAEDLKSLAALASTRFTSHGPKLTRSPGAMMPTLIPMLKQYFQGKTLRESPPQLVEEFKNNRLNTPTKKNTPR